MVEDNNKEIVKELLGKKISKQIDDDLKLGKHLQDICKEVDNEQGKCSNEHKIRVIDYINRVNKIYHPFVMLYATLNNISTSRGDSMIECNTIGHYVFIIEKVKEAKDLNDDFEHLCKILTIKK